MGCKWILSLPIKFTGRGWHRWIPRLLSMAVGVVFLMAGLLKATDMEMFIRQIRDYGIISNNLLLALGAWGLIIAECGLGMALILIYRPRVTISITAFLLMIFLGVTLWAWVTGVTKDCGCFGAWVRRTPGEAVIEDMVLIAALFPAWIGHGRSPARGKRVRLLVVIATGLTGLILPVAFGFPISTISPKHPDQMDITRDLSEIQGPGRTDLKHGTYLLILLDTGCLHCQESVEEINLLGEEPDVPPLIGLSSNDEGQVKDFVEQFQPIFPIWRIRDDVFWRLLGDGDVPRTLLIKDKRIMKVWDKNIPDIEMLKNPRSTAAGAGD